MDTLTYAVFYPSKDIDYEDFESVPDCMRHLKNLHCVLTDRVYRGRTFLPWFTDKAGQLTDMRSGV